MVTGKCKQVGLGRIYVVKMKIIFFFVLLEIRIIKNCWVAKGMVTNVS